MIWNTGQNLDFEYESCFKVWDHGSGLDDAIAEERKGFNQGDYKNMKDMWAIIYLHCLWWLRWYDGCQDCDGYEIDDK